MENMKEAPRKENRCAFLLGVLVSVAAEVGTATVPTPYPLEEWAAPAAISSVEVSPDGKHLALFRVTARDGDPILEVYDASDLATVREKKPFRMNADPMELVGFDWVTDTHILFGARQQVRDRIEGFNQGTYEFKFGLLNIKDKKVSTFGAPGRVDVINVLPKQPNKVLLEVEAPGPAKEGPASRIVKRFLPRDYYEFDLEKGRKKLVIQGKLSMGRYGFDADGHPWLGRGFDLGKGEYVHYHRRRGEKKWREVHRQHEDEFSYFGVVGFDVDDPDKLFVIANNGHNTEGLWSLNVSNGRLTPIYQRKDVNVWSVLRSSQRWTDPDRVVGYQYISDRWHREYIHKVEGATHVQLASIVPHAYNLSITSRSRDGATLTVRNSGPKDPGTYYLLKDGHFKPVGSRQPRLESEKLAVVEHITYRARDGKVIPAWLTVPHGKAPFPLVIMPHGGPFVTEAPGWDTWAQLLANNGYMVLQPQYRGSTNYGIDFYTSAFLDPEGGQGGYKMQDDKDDGAKHLVKIGRADPDRLAMFGWSYGGYAAAVAAARTPQIYQCVVAGAGVYDTLQQVNYYRFRMRGAGRIEQLRMWDDSVSPIEEVAKVNVPMLIVHGDVDQRVPVEHAKKYTKALDDHGKTYKYLELAKADHFSNTLRFDHRLEFYTAMMDFLANDCGPDGL